jgi:uncharacterized protein (TIGR03437 family)
VAAWNLPTNSVTTVYITGVGSSGGGGPGPTFQASLPLPTINSVQNAASNIPAGLPNAGIAPGAIFAIYGLALGPPAVSIAQSAFQTTSLSGTSVAVTVAGTTVNALMYYTSAGQVAALLPSNTPAGSGTLTVTYNGRTGAPAPITVVASNVGIFTIASNGMGPGVVTYPDYSLVSPSRAATCGGAYTTCGAANPGDTLTLWATGLGPVSGGDASGAGLGQTMPNPLLTLWVGGVQAAVKYQGRSGCCIGEDQIVFTVPDNVPTGCAVPLVVQAGNLVSNTIAMPVAKGSRDCTPSNAALASANVRYLDETGPITYANIKLSTNVGPQLSLSDLSQFQFIKVLSYQGATQPFLSSYLDDVPAGTCTVYASLIPPLIPRDNKVLNGLSPITAGADAGTSFTLTGPIGSVDLAGSPGQFNVLVGYGGLPLGEFTMTGAGGADIGPFSAPFSTRAAPTLTSPLCCSSPQVSRLNGLTVTWHGGSPDSSVQIELSSPTDRSYPSGATLICNATSVAGTFTIPPYALLALPASTSGDFSLTQQTEAGITAKNLDFGEILSRNAPSSFGGVTFK